jgi:hypothetical protein
VSSQIQVEVFGEVRACDLVLRDALNECAGITVETDGVVTVPEGVLPLLDEIAERHGCDVFEALRTSQARTLKR